MYIIRDFPHLHQLKKNRGYKKMTFKPIDELFFTDDYMFGAVMRNPEICKSILETLLNIQIEKLEYPELQKSISTYYETMKARDPNSVTS